MNTWIYLSDDPTVRPIDKEFICFTKNRNGLDFGNSLSNYTGVYFENEDCIKCGLDCLGSIPFKDIMRWQKC